MKSNLNDIVEMFEYINRKQYDDGIELIFHLSKVLTYVNYDDVFTSDVLSKLTITSQCNAGIMLISKIADICLIIDSKTIPTVTSEESKLTSIVEYTHPSGGLLAFVFDLHNVLEHLFFRTRGKDGYHRAVRARIKEITDEVYHFIETIIEGIEYVKSKLESDSIVT